jgi:excisionase family DNA binding protein
MRNKLEQGNHFSDSIGPANELLTVEDVAVLLKVPKSWVYQRIRKSGFHRLPHVKLGKYLRFEEKAVWDFVARNRKSQ